MTGFEMGGLLSAEAARAYWLAAQRRDWDAFGALLSDDVVYDLPQTRERVRGRAAYVQFNREYPDNWSMVLDRVVGEGDHAATWATFTVDAETMPALTFFDLTDGLISGITDFWPVPYDPPPGREHLVERY